MGSCSFNKMRAGTSKQRTRKSKVLKDIQNIENNDIPVHQTVEACNQLSNLNEIDDCKNRKIKKRQKDIRDLSAARPISYIKYTKRQLRRSEEINSVRRDLRNMIKNANLGLVQSSTNLAENTAIRPKRPRLPKVSKSSTLLKD